MWLACINGHRILTNHFRYLMPQIYMYLHFSYPSHAHICHRNKDRQRDCHYLLFSFKCIFSCCGHAQNTMVTGSWVPTSTQLGFVGTKFLSLLPRQQIKVPHRCKVRHLSHSITKPTKWLCAQWRLRSAWAFAQSDQNLRCPLEQSWGHKLPIERIAKTLMTDQTGRMPRLRHMSFCWFFQKAAHVFCGSFLDTQYHTRQCRHHIESCSVCEQLCTHGSEVWFVYKSEYVK